VAITVRRWEAKGGNRDLVYEVALWGFPAGIIGGRLYFLATSWNEVPPHWWGPFAVWKGGLGIWGGIAAGTVAGLWVLRRRGANIPVFLDAAAPALLVAQAIGRVGNYFNQELFGGPTTLPWGLEISPAHRPVGYAQYATFHPTFLYELIWNLLLAGALVWLDRRRSIRAPGLFALYVAGYSLARIGEELLRVDPAHHILGLRLNFYVATLLCVAGIAWFIRIQRAGLKRSAGKTVRHGGALLAAGGLLALAARPCRHAAHRSGTLASGKRRHLRRDLGHTGSRCSQRNMDIFGRGAAATTHGRGNHRNTLETHCPKGYADDTAKPYIRHGDCRTCRNEAAKHRKNTAPSGQGGSLQPV
jgi:prolipoprotein diacylglyceryl transferase